MPLFKPQLKCHFLFNVVRIVIVPSLTDMKNLVLGWALNRIYLNLILTENYEEGIMSIW